ncbi:MAG: SMI1/KNR4 family protein [Verrucomicrobiales bacterium]|nr:SMI1/KNR4 family protein [Verrucomicrobiales bacterium]
MESEEHEFFIEVEDPGPVYDVADAFIQLHQELDVAFPRSFVDTHLSGITHLHNVNCGGDRPENCDLHDLLVARCKHYGTDIRTAKRRLLDGLSESRPYFANVFPFGQDGAGGQYCFDNTMGDDPFIAKFDWDYHFLARSFDEFLARSKGEDVPPISEQEVTEFVERLPELW